MVKVNEIRKSYRNEVRKTERVVLDGISMTINPGDALSIVGPSGSGKSTLLNIIGTLDMPDSGTVDIDGERIDTLSTRELARVRNQKIGFIFQQHHLLPHLTLWENILVPLLPVRERDKKARATEKARKLVEHVGLSELIHQFPAQLSVGECQRVSLVRALVNNPQLILADEPTGSLDEKNAVRMVDLLLDISREHKVALVMVTHASELAAKLPVNFKLIGGKLETMKSNEPNSGSK